VLAFIRKAWALNVHLELTTLVVPGLNDSDAEIDRCIEFIASLSTDIPWHLSAYHPAYQWDAPPTSARRLIALARRARKTLLHVYTGNIAGGLSDTPCPYCGAVLVRRDGYHVNTEGLAFKDGAYCCADCGNAAPITYSNAKFQA
jgi:pyruvate formate lyase activating enzyme